MASRKSLCQPVWNSTLPNPFMTKHYNEWPCWTLICSLTFWGIQIPHLSVVQRNLKSSHLSSSVPVVGGPPMNFQTEIPSEIWDKHEEVSCISCLQHIFNAFEISSATTTKFSFQIICQSQQLFCPLKRHGGHSGAPSWNCKSRRNSSVDYINHLDTNCNPAKIHSHVAPGLYQV